MKLILILLCICSLVACKHNLTRDDARKILQPRYPERKQQMLNITGWCSPFMSPEGKRMLSAVQELELTGYLTQSGFTAQYLDGMHTDCRIDFTDKAKPYLMQTTEDYYLIDAFHVNLGEITGIRDGGTTDIQNC